MGNVNKKILLGEDDLDEEELLNEVFTAIDNSFSLVFVNSGKKILATLREMKDDELPCLIILDYNMPEMNGAEILHELNGHSRFTKIPKLIWSTSGSETYRKVCLELGACDYIRKPSNFTQLQETSRYILSFCTVEE